jgi:putative endonuclease
MWKVYILKCVDGRFYTGIALDVVRRFCEHLRGTASKYTRSHRPSYIYWQSDRMTHSQALKLEIQIKKMSHEQKKGFGGYVRHSQTVPEQRD